MTTKHTREGYVGTIISAHGTDARVWIEAHGQNQTEAEKLHALHAAAPMLAEALKAMLPIFEAFTQDELSVTTIDEAIALLPDARAALATAGVVS